MKRILKMVGLVVAFAAATLDVWGDALVVETGVKFDVVDVGDAPADAQVIMPWRVVTLDQEYCGGWVVAGDLNGDGAVEWVSAQNHNEGDTHYTSAAVAHKLDGTVMWRWGDPKLGRKELHHDVALQIHDWHGDGKPEVVVLGDQTLVELDGITGQEVRRLPIPAAASDSLAFADFSGVGRATDFLVKTRYTAIWAYNQDGALLWESKMPGGYRTAHQAQPVDIDGDGRDEIMAGYAFLGHDGQALWTLQSEKIDLNKGHLDCARLVKRGNTPEETRIVGTCCGANGLVMIDGAGKTIWEVTGQHYESIQVGRMLPEPPGVHILVDIDHRPRGESDLCVFDQEGQLRGKIRGNYCRQHGLVDWDGDGLEEMVVGESGAMYNHTGKRMATLTLPGGEGAGVVLFGDFTGDGVMDIARCGGGKVFIYQNEHGTIPEPKLPLGTPPNFTFY